MNSDSFGSPNSKVLAPFGVRLFASFEEGPDEYEKLLWPAQVLLGGESMPIQHVIARIDGHVIFLKTTRWILFLVTHKTRMGWAYVEWAYPLWAVKAVQHHAERPGHVLFTVSLFPYRPEDKYRLHLTYTINMQAAAAAEFIEVRS